MVMKHLILTLIFLVILILIVVLLSPNDEME